MEALPLRHLEFWITGGSDWVEEKDLATGRGKWEHEFPKGCASNSVAPKGTAFSDVLF